MNLQTIGAQQPRPNEHLLTWHEGGFRLSHLAIKREVHQLEVFLTVLPTG